MRMINHFPRDPLRRLAWTAAAAAALVAVLLALQPSTPSATDDPAQSMAEDTPQREPMPAGPAWRYGQAEARFTIIEYADLECPFCRTYFAALKPWIDAHPEVNWQWHHLPLPMHEPAASADARLVECVGQADGHAAFWQAVEWVYAHTRGEGQGLPEGLRYPGLTPDAQRCLDSERPDAVIRAQRDDAALHRIAATPTLRLRDNESGKTLLLRGPLAGDALLSAFDLLAAGDPAADAPAPSSQMPADLDDDASRIK